MTEPQPSCQKAAIARRIVRYADLEPCYHAFIDTRTPGSEAKENFTIIGPGVSENPRQFVHITEPHGFNIGGARQPPDCVNSQHSHGTAEVFVIHSGRWRFVFGPDGEDAAFEAGPGDLVSFPTDCFRGFTNIGDDTGFLWSVLGGDDPGRVTWAPRVFELARDYGLVLLENGALVDTSAGETIPAEVRPMPATTYAEAAELRTPSAEDIKRTHVSADAGCRSGGGIGGHGAVEIALIGAASSDEGLQAGLIDRPHGFSVRRLELAWKARVEPHSRGCAEVLFVHSGQLGVTIDGAEALLRPGDTLSIPTGAIRSFEAGPATVVFIVRGGDRPPPPVWESPLNCHR